MDKKRIGQIKEQFDLVIHSGKTDNIEFWDEICQGYSLLENTISKSLYEWVSPLPGLTLFFLKTYTVLVSIAGPFSPLNTFSGIMALQERNEVNNYEHYKCGEKIWTEIWRKSGALYLASSATWLHLHLCWNAITGFGVCLYQYDRYRLSYGMAFGLVVIFISSLNAQKIINVNIKMYIFDHLRMYKFAYSSSCVMYSLDR